MGQWLLENTWYHEPSWDDFGIAQFRRALEIVKRLGARGAEGNCMWLIARALAKAGRSEESEHYVRETYEIARKGIVCLDCTGWSITNILHYLSRRTLLGRLFGMIVQIGTLKAFHKRNGAPYM